MTSIEWLIDALENPKLKWDDIKIQAKEMHKQEMAQLPQQEISDESWEGCDGCTEQDEIMYKNGYVKGYNAAVAELPKEISDEEIEKAATQYEPMVTRRAWVSACKWYREQLKKK